MKKKFITLAVLLLTSPIAAMAGEAHICFSSRVTPEVSMSGVASLSDETKFNCAGLGEMTIPQLAKNGWKIGQVTQDADMRGISWQLLIQK